MKSSGGNGPPQRSRQPVLPSFSTRTLHHPSFLPLYMAAASGQHHRACEYPKVYPAVPAEFFYTDPTMGPGRRVPNIVSDLTVLDWFQLNTPPPVMSACSAPPNRPDLFRSGPHPIRNLGSPTLRMPTNCQPNQAVLQLTQEEDQGVTNLLTLHYQSVEPRTVPVELNSSLGYQTPTDSTSDGEVHRPLCRDVQQRGGWSHTELEAANTLLNHFSLVEENHICSLNHHKSSGTLSGPLPDQHHEAPSVSTETQPECEASPALVTSHCTPSDTGYISFRSVRENGGQGRGDCRSAEHRTVYGAFSGLREQMLSDLEEDAVLVLLSLSDMGTLDTVQ